MDRFKIGIKLGCSFAVIIILALGAGISGNYTIKRISENTTELYNHPYAVSTAILRIDCNIVRMHRSMKDVALSRSSSELENAKTQVELCEKKVFQDFEIVKERFLGNRNDIEATMQLIVDWKPIRDEVIALMQDGRRDDAAQITRGKGADHVMKINNSLKQITDFAEKKAGEFVETTGMEVKHSMVNRNIFIVINVITGILLAFFASRSIAKPLENLSRMAINIAGGDLSVEIFATRRLDEVGILWNAFYKMVASLREQIKEISEGANILASSTEEIAVSVSQLVSSSSETASSVSETSSTVEEVRQTAQVSSQKAALVSQVSQKALNESEIGLDHTQVSIQEMANIKKQMTYIAESIVKLSDQSQTIGDIIASVADIAEQSNLLAVNASIEAVKAGEQGKGFGVVAQEIRRLADQSKQSTFQVRTILSDIQKAVSTAVMATEQGEKAVGAGELKVVQTGKVIEALARRIGDSAQAAVQIAASSQEQMVGVEQVATAMENIKQASHQNLAGSRQLEEAAKNLSSLGQKLKKLASQYKS